MRRTLHYRRAGVASARNERPGGPAGPFVVTYSNRLFPEKAVAVWYSSAAEERARLIAAYFHYAEGWDAPTAQDRSPRPGLASDPLFAVWARKARSEAIG